MRYSYYDYASRAVLDTSPNYGEGGGWVISRVNTPHLHRGQGIARELMAQALADADKEDTRLWLAINPYGPMDYEQLEAWYLRCGFRLQPDGRYLRLPQTHKGEDDV